MKDGERRVPILNYNRDIITEIQQIAHRDTDCGYCEELGVTARNWGMQVLWKVASERNVLQQRAFAGTRIPREAPEAPAAPIRSRLTFIRPRQWLRSGVTLSPTCVDAFLDGINRRCTCRRTCRWRDPVFIAGGTYVRRRRRRGRLELRRRGGRRGGGAESPRRSSGGSSSRIVHAKMAPLTPSSSQTSGTRRGKRKSRIPGPLHGRRSSARKGREGASSSTSRRPCATASGDPPTGGEVALSPPACAALRGDRARRGPPQASLRWPVIAGTVASFSLGSTGPRPRRRQQ